MMTITGQCIPWHPKGYQKGDIVICSIHCLHVLVTSQDVSRICQMIAFVKNKSIMSFDDDHLRLQSNGVEDAGCVRIRNPKAFGPVFHPIVSMGTGLFQAGHIARRNESNTDRAKHCLMSLDHQPLKKNLELCQIFACDRGYSSKELTEFLIDSKLHLDFQLGRADPTTMHINLVELLGCMTGESALD